MKKLVLALLLTAATAVSAFAQEADFATVDANGDGFVSIDEATEAGWEFTEEAWADADGNGDDVLDADEFAAATQN